MKLAKRSKQAAQYDACDQKKFQARWERKSISKSFLRLWDSASEPQWEPLSPNGENLEQWWIFPAVTGLQKNPSRVHWQEQEVTQEPRQTSKELQASLASVNVSNHDSALTKNLRKNGTNGRVARRKPLLTKRNIKACLAFAKKHSDDPQAFWDNVLWTDGSKVELFERHGSRYIWRKVNNALHNKNIIPNMVVVVWWCRDALLLQDLGNLP